MKLSKALKTLFWKKNFENVEKKDVNNEPNENTVVIINGIQYEFNNTSAISTAMLIAKALEEERKGKSN